MQDKHKGLSSTHKEYIWNYEITIFAPPSQKLGMYVTKLRK